MLRRAAQAGSQLLARSRTAQLQQQRFLNVHEYQVRVVGVQTLSLRRVCFAVEYRGG